MKKIFTLISFAALLFSCVKPEMDAPVVEEISYNTILTADIPAVKVAIDNQYTKLTWSNGDKISVLTSSGVYREFTYTGEDGAKSASFKGNLEEGETLGGYAIYPAHESHAVANGRPKVYLPNKYAWEEGEVMGPMVATISDGKAAFSHAGGLFAFDVQNLPAGTKGFKFTTSVRDITGGFAYQNAGTLNAVESTSATYVTMSFDPLQKTSNMKFYIPVPTGSYPDFTIHYINDSNVPVKMRESKSTNVIEAGTVKVFSVSADGGAWYVTANGSASANGLSWANATTLTKALSKAQDGDVIHVGAGTYVPDTYITGYAVTDGTVAGTESTATSADHKAFVISKAITLIGGYPAAGGNMSTPESNPTILSGNNTSDHVVIVAAPKAKGTVKMSGFTVTGAASVSGTTSWRINNTTLADHSGAFCALNTDLALEYMTISGNSTAHASAMYSASSKVDIKNCTFSSNTSSGNGVVWFREGSEVNFANSEISGNKAVIGAGLYLTLVEGAEMTANISEVTISENEATAEGGGVFIKPTGVGQKLNATIEGCTISKNEAEAGAGMYLANASGVTVRNTEISGNIGGTTTQGGTFTIIDADARFERCTFSANQGNTTASMLIKAGLGVNNNVFDKCVWKNNTCTSWATIYILTSGEFANNVAMTNCLFDSNEAVGRGGAIYARSNASGQVHLKCVNSTFHGNSATAAGTAIVCYSNNDSYTTTVDLISCTIAGNKNTGAYYAVTSEKAKSGTTLKGNPIVNLYNTLIVNNEGVHATNGTIYTYNVGAINSGKIIRKYCQNGTTYYNASGSNAGANTFDYATMLGALNTSGVCPLLLPASNPAVTGGMPLGELLALASDNVPASVLSKDQTGNTRNGNVIGAWAGVSAPTELTLSKTSVSAPAAGGTFTVNVTGASTWTVSSPDSWITDLAKSGSSLTFKVPAYTALEDRTGSVYVTLNNRYYAITVTQAADVTAYYKGATSDLGRQIAHGTSFISTVTSDSYTQLDYGVGMLKMQFKGQEAGTDHPMAIYMYEVDLSGDATLAVTCANDANSSIASTASGSTKVQTIRRQMAAMQANRPSQVVLGGVNGDFFVAASNNLLQGACHRNGVCLKDTFYENVNTVFAIKKDGSAMIMNQDQYADQKADILEAIGGRQRLLAYGEVYVTNNSDYTPRTCVGVSKDGTKVYLLVIDGRDNSWSYGATFHDAAKILLAAGAYNAINVDGGGSSVFIQRSSEDGTSYSDYSILNKPTNTDGSYIEREVVNGLAIIRK